MYFNSVKLFWYMLLATVFCVATGSKIFPN
jgi:hypothetical protein